MSLSERDALAPCTALSPPPAPPRCGARHPSDVLSPPLQVLGNFHGGGPGTATQPPVLRSCPPPGPSLHSPPEQAENSLSSVHSESHRSLPLHPGLCRHAPLDWWKSRSPPPSPTHEIASRDRLGAATLAQGAGPSPLPLFSAERSRQ